MPSHNDSWLLIFFNSCAKQNQSSFLLYFPASLVIFIKAGIWSQINYVYALWLFVSFPVAGEKHSVDFSSNGHNQPQLPFGCDPAAEILHGQLVHSDSSENSTAGSQVEHQKSVKAEQLYDHAFYSTMLLYHGS